MQACFQSAITSSVRLLCLHLLLHVTTLRHWCARILFRLRTILNYIWSSDVMMVITVIKGIIGELENDSSCRLAGGIVKKCIQYIAFCAVCCLLICLLWCISDTYNLQRCLRECNSKVVNRWMHLGGFRYLLPLELLDRLRKKDYGIEGTAFSRISSNLRIQSRAILLKSTFLQASQQVEKLSMVLAYIIINMLTTHS